MAERKPQGLNVMLQSVRECQLNLVSLMRFSGTSPLITKSRAFYSNRVFGKSLQCLCHVAQCRCAVASSCALVCVSCDVVGHSLRDTGAVGNLFERVSPRVIW